MDIIDRGCEREEYLRTEALRIHAEATRRAVDHQCVECGKDIKDRQQILPFARRCMPCQLHAEAAARRRGC